MLSSLSVTGCHDRPLEDGSAVLGSFGPNLTLARESLSPLPGGDQHYPFTVSPNAPLAFNEPGWDVQMYSRDRETWYAPEPMEAHHGMDCGGYPGTHTITKYEELVFRCRNHIMTSIKAGGYGVVMLTPDRMLDLSKGEAVVRFDLSTFQSSDRDWVDVWLSSYDEQLALPAAKLAPGLHGPPRNGLWIEKTKDGGFCPHYVRDFVVTHLDCAWWVKLADKIALSATTRSVVEIRLTSTHVKVSMPLDSIVFADVDLPAPLPFQAAVVQFGHYSYNPEKCEWNCAELPPKKANTWHWDEIHIAPSIPFGIMRGDRRYVDGAGGTVNFAAPAREGSRLRFFATGSAPEISFDGGSTWQNPTEQVTGKADSYERQYWTLMPAGSSQVMMRPKVTLSGWPWLDVWMARDFAVWSRSGESLAPSPAPAPTPAPVPQPVVPTPVATIGVALATNVLIVGQTEAASAALRDATGAPLTGRTISWSSSNPAVAAVSTTGIVTAVSPGSAMIQVTSEGISSSASVTVKAALLAVADVLVALNTATLSPGQTATATASLRDATNGVLTGRLVTWSSSNPAVATVSAEGLVTAVSTGTASITGTSEGKSASAPLTVTAVRISSIVVTTPATFLRVGQSELATASVRDAANAVLPGREVTWSSSNTKVARVSSTGIVTATGAGTVKIIATSEGKRGSVGITIIHQN